MKYTFLQTSWYGCGENQSGLQLIKPSMGLKKKNTITDLETNASQFNFIMLINDKDLLTAMGLKKSWQKETRAFNLREWRWLCRGKQGAGQVLMGFKWSECCWR